VDDLSGADYGGKHTKAELIKDILTKYRLVRNETVMLGDTHFDIKGAQESGIDSIALGYGFGHEKDLIALHPTYYFGTVEALTDFLTDL
jgi:phosphoglycolate phosphatase